ncbi:MAG: RNA polymerase sigma factor [Brevundimonas sp.]|uniref:RNA polymerase sigma factor n=1 Tax=Brevundimonas sp. TaxID=1871086 RepID=UPI00271BE7E5|nr:RNA polymerase sigma factor [Brevundimonas sp.]MDO9588761.1 RNA polymerase sigma factor [Brevundimonas sp.]MDP3657523.1 RNA polymerase sigma factor [Brevundimonas sp.]MDZ4108605.1 RNA polymerase sigma factor [Brevundimonas sp.]
MGLSETERVYSELLVTLVQAGDRRAAERLVARWQPRLIRTARRLLGNDEQALDAVQETWGAVFQGWMRLSDPARFPGWVFGILHRKCVDRIRDESRRRTGSAALGPGPAVTAAVGEDSLAIAQALDGLSHGHRIAAILFFGEGLTLSEIAVATGVPTGTAKSRIFHARRQLQAALNGEVP